MVQTTYAVKGLKMPVSNFDEYLSELETRPEEAPLLAAARARVALGLQVHDLRTARQLTQQEVAVRAGISQADVSRIESGAANPTVKTLAALGEVLGARLVLTESAPQS